MNLVRTLGLGTLLGLAMLTVPRIAHAEGPLAFHTLSPCRVIDTRSTGGAIAGGATRSITMHGACGIPSTARAVAVNVTVVGSTAPGFVALFPYGTAWTGVSTVNFDAGATVANGAIAPLGTSAPDLNIIVSTTVNVIIDVNGYFQ